MVAVVESSTQKSAPALSTFSALIGTASGSSIPESAADQARQIIGRSRAHTAATVADHQVVDKPDPRGVDMPDPRGVDKPDPRGLGKADNREVVRVRDSSPHFFSY